MNSKFYITLITTLYTFPYFSRTFNLTKLSATSQVGSHSSVYCCCLRTNWTSGCCRFDVLEGTGRLKYRMVSVYLYYKYVLAIESIYHGKGLRIFHTNFYVFRFNLIFCRNLDSHHQRSLTCTRKYLHYNSRFFLLKNNLKLFREKTLTLSKRISNYCCVIT